jgi:uncharacterized protein (DUF1810 family)
MNPSHLSETISSWFQVILSNTFINSQISGFMSNTLERFVEAQGKFEIYEKAIRELTDGRKKSHWIWFVFPQIRGIGTSHNATYYGIQGIEEAKNYLEHPLLGPRYIEAMGLVNHKLLNEGVSLLNLMSAEIDCLKFTSSLTLFSKALKEFRPTDDVIYSDVSLLMLEMYIRELVDSNQIGNFPCQRTINILN